MDKFLTDVTTSYFWLAVVFVGLLINIVSAYIKSPLDRAFGKVSSTWRSRTAKQQLRLDQLVAQLSDAEFRAFTRWRSQTLWSRTSVLLVLLGFLAVGSTLAFVPVLLRVAFLVLMSFCMYQANAMIDAAILCERALRTYEESRTSMAK